ncbi:hypothetical protein [Eubacterium barkeri]|uniref:Uncharacterized protein n=1 Tax=Eubacterium barkeri TaxID=1528 RepID=A0A1H3D078_EUBBA|nr:hypothetical protein [Eubacterium barkeri]SDX59089.1 hypothetical protein SAMN04488579_10423 [Eubacterium barkeri]
MNELDIKRHSFDLAKKRLKEFSEKNMAELAIDRVKTDGDFFGLGDHKVTGYELNNRLESIQGHLIDINSTNNKTIKEFREIYNALNALDKDYITSIVASVKAIEKTSNDVKAQQEVLKQHHDKIVNQQNKLDFHQVEIDKNVDNMKKIITTLKAFKEKLDGYRHLTDIDKIWSDCNTIRKNIQVISDSITALSTRTTNDIATANSKNKNLLEQVNNEIFTLRKEAKTYMDFFSDLSEKLDGTANRLDEQIPIIEYNSEFASQMNSITHLNEVDFIWEDVTKSKESISKIETELQTVDVNIRQIQNHLNQVDEFIAVLNGYTHLKDIDSMWENLSTVKKEVAGLFNVIDDSNKVLQVHQNNLERLCYSSESQQDELNKISQNQDEAKKYAEGNRKSITELQAFKCKVDSIEHITDIDFMWEQEKNVRINLAEADNRIVSLQEKTTEIDKEIADNTAKMQDQVASLGTRLKYSYYIAGGALGLVIVELVLALTGVI